MGVVFDEYIGMYSTFIMDKHSMLPTLHSTWLFYGEKCKKMFYKVTLFIAYLEGKIVFFCSSSQKLFLKLE